MAKSKLPLLLGLGAGYLVLTHKSRPPMVRGDDPGFDWQGQHIKGGQGSAITNLGSSIKTDYVLVSNSMNNYAGQTWGYDHTPTQNARIARLTWGYALKVIDYWVGELARFGPSLSTARKSVLNESARRMVLAQSVLGGNASLVATSWNKFLNKLPPSAPSDYAVWKGVASSIAYVTPARVHTDNEMMSTSDAKTFWSAVSNVGIDFDYTKYTPTKDTVWTAGWKAAGDAIKGAPGKAVELAAEGTWWGLKTAFKNPIFAALALGAGYVWWRRR